VDETSVTGIAPTSEWDLPYYRPVTEPAPEPPRTPPPTPPRAGDGREPPPRAASRGRFFVALVATTALVAGAVGGVIGARVTDDDPPAASSSTPSRSVSTGPSSTIAGPALDLQGILAKAEPAVVTIRTSGIGARGASGTGIVLTADGEVLTNAHVVRGATEVRVRLEGESQSRDATIIGSDGANDLALLKIRNASGLATASLGNSADVKVGDDVVAIGNALGLQGEPTVTRGIVSALDRSLDTLSGLLQHDATINPGNSGGPLVNRSGDVIGINTATAGQGTGIGFAIPIDHAKDVVERLRRGETAPPVGWLGVQTDDPDDGSIGALIVDVVVGQPADDAGLQPGDLITGVDGKQVAGAEELGGLIREHEPGETIDLTVTRNGQSHTVRVTLGSRPSN
jgi:S1-C subfamily serine protease